MSPLKTVPEHLAAVLSLIDSPLPEQDQRLEDALGCVLAEPITAPFDLPRFDNSAMDGYALRAADVTQVPVSLPVSADLAATARSSELVPLLPGTAARIMTGAQVPIGADTIVRVEWTDGGTETVRIDQIGPKGQHVRRTGEDIRAEELVLSTGTVLGPAELGIAAAFGQSTVRTYGRPRVCVISTGSELVEPVNSTQLAPGAIFDSNSFALQALACRADATAIRMVAVGDDDLDHAREVLNEAAANCDLIVTTGGVSAGAYEVMKDLLATSPTVRFEQVAMQPGKPQGLGTYLGIPILTFPGNPVSCFVSFELFAVPLIRKLAGRPRPTPGWQRAELAERISPREHLHTFPRAHLNPATNQVSLIGGPGSHLLASLAKANCLVSVPPGVEMLHAGSPVEVIPYS